MIDCNCKRLTNGEQKQLRPEKCVNDIFVQRITPLRQNLKLALTLTLKKNISKSRVTVRVRVSLGFGLVCTPLGKNIAGSFSWSYPFLFSGVLNKSEVG